MKLSTSTLEILKNFATINSNLFIENGQNIIRTVSRTETIFAEAKVEERFPVDVSIFNLQQFLKTMSMFEEPDLEFEEKYMLIRDGKTSFKFFYNDPKCLKYPKGSVKGFDTTLAFDIDEDTLGQITQASRVTSLPDVLFDYDGTDALLQVMERKNPTSNVFSLDLDGTGEETKAFMKMDNLKIMSGNYHVDMQNKVSKWANDNLDLYYCIAMDVTDG